MLHNEEIDEPVYEDPNFDLICKVILIGDSAAGKSSLAEKFARDVYDETKGTTIGVDFFSKVVAVDFTKVRLEVWDTAGQERYNAITSQYFRGADGVILVYDITNRESFLNIRKWLERALQHSSKDVSVILVGNKSDLDLNRATSREEGQAFADEHQMMFLETSAKHGGPAVENVFELMARDVFRRCVETEMMQISESAGISGADSPATKTKKLYYGPAATALRHKQALKLKEQENQVLDDFGLPSSMPSRCC